MKLRLLPTLMLTALAATSIHAQSGLTVTVHCTEPGTLFVKIMEQIEELDVDIKDITNLTVSGTLGNDDIYVQRDQLPNLQSADFGGVDADGAKYVYMTNHKHLKRCVLPTAATELRSSVLSGCDSLTTVAVPPGLLVIPDNFATGCKLLASIDIPQSVTKIGYAAFQGCASLTAVTIPAGVTELNNTFWGCKSLKNATFLGNNLVLRHNVFRDTGFESFTLPQGVTIVGDAAFGACENLKSFTFPDGLTDESMVGTSTLWNCHALEHVRLPADLTVIPKQFLQGTALASVDFPSTVTSIGDEAFNGMTAWKHPVIPNTVTKVGDHLFWGSKIEEIDWPESLHIIPYETFRSCEQLYRVGIPATVDSIGWNAFLYCSSLTSAHLPEGLHTLNGTFNGCTSLSEVNIPSTVTVLERGTFNKCKFTHIDIPEGVTYIGWGCFGGVPLTEVKLPSTLQQIGAYAFNGGAYKRMVVPEGVFSIDSRAFYSDSLKVLDLPSTLLSVGDIMLGDNAYHHPDSVIIRAMVPPYCSGQFFISRDCPTTLYVPKPSLSLYQDNPDYNNVENMGTIDIDSPVLNITWNTVITPASGLQEKKYDVNMVSTHDIEHIEVRSSNHPSLIIDEGANFRVGKFSITFDGNCDWGYRQDKYDTFINKGSVSIDDIDLRCRFTGKYFFTVPFDVDYNDIAPDNPVTPFAIFRYDGAARANAEFDNTWVRVLPGETLRPGIAYRFTMEPVPYQDYTGKWTCRWGHLHLKPHSGGTNYFATKSDVTVPLNHYAAEFPHNSNWNFVGMPFPSFIDIRGVDYDGPFMILTNANYGRVSWKAVSALDDEIVLYPYEAMFVQCPDDVSAITFSADRRQTNSKFVKGDTQNSRMSLRRADKNRQRVVYNAMLSRSTEQGDSLVANTRFVINPAATTGYDIGRDAPLMADTDADAPATLFYTQAGGLAYAINERPLADGIVYLGMQLAEAGTYTISLSAKGGSEVSGISTDTPVWLIDNETGTRTNLLPSLGEGQGEGYTFTISDAGSLNNRFVIALGNADPTAITDVQRSSTSEAAEPSATFNVQRFFNLQGQPVSTPTKGIYIKDGKKIVK